MFFPTVALVYFTILSYLQFPRTAFSLTQRCPWHYSAWLSAVPDITQLDSALSRTRSAWLSAVPDITQLHLVNLWVVVIVYINTFLTKQYIVGSGSGCGIVPWRSRDFFHFFTHKKLSQDFACNKNIGFQISLKTSEFSTLFLHTLFGVQAPNKKDKKCFLSNKNIAGWKGRTVSRIFAIGCVNTPMSLFSPDCSFKNCENPSKFFYQCLRSHCRVRVVKDYGATESA